MSRVGRSAQHSAMKKVSGSMRLDVAQYRELAVFAQFGSDIDSSTKELLDRGERLIELLKQPQDNILSLAQQAALLISFDAGHFQKISTADVGPFKNYLLEYLASTCAKMLSTINTTGDFSEEDKKELTDISQKALSLFLEEKKDAERQ